MCNNLKSHETSKNKDHSLGEDGSTCDPLSDVPEDSRVTVGSGSVSLQKGGYAL